MLTIRKIIYVHLWIKSLGIEILFKIWFPESYSENSNKLLFFSHHHFFDLLHYVPRLLTREIAKGV